MSCSQMQNHNEYDSKRIHSCIMRRILSLELNDPPMGCSSVGILKGQPQEDWEFESTEPGLCCLKLKNQFMISLRRLGLADRDNR